MPDFENKLMPPKIIEKVRKQSRKNKLSLCEGQNPQIKEVSKFCFQCTETLLLSEADFFFFFFKLSFDYFFLLQTVQILPLSWVGLKLSSHNDLYIGRRGARPSLRAHTRHGYYNISGTMVWVDFGVSGLDLPSRTGHLDMVPTSHPALAPSNPSGCQSCALPSHSHRFAPLLFKPDCRF